MKTTEELKDYLLKHYVDCNNNLWIEGLDFSDFDGDVYIGRMKVKGDLHQAEQEVEGSLFQRNQIVKGNLIQDYQRVDGYLTQSNQVVTGNLYNRLNQHGGHLFEEPSKLMSKKITVQELAELGYELVEEKG